MRRSCVTPRGRPSIVRWTRRRIACLLAGALLTGSVLTGAPVAAGGPFLDTGALRDPLPAIEPAAAPLALDWEKNVGPASGAVACLSSRAKDPSVAGRRTQRDRCAAVCPPHYARWGSCAKPKTRRRITMEAAVTSR